MAKKCLCSFFDQDASGLIFAAFRYYKGRMTISACDFASRLSVVYPRLPETYQKLIRAELDADFERDDDSRENGEQYHPLGMNCDRESWELVRQAYRKDNRGRMKRKTEMMLCPKVKKCDIYGTRYSPDCHSIPHNKTVFCAYENFTCPACVPVKAKRKNKPEAKPHEKER